MLGFVAAFLLSPAAAIAAGDAAKGEIRHKSCLQCHGSDVYLPPKRRVQSLAALRREVIRWSDHYNPPFSKADVDDVVAYLNREFYRFR